MRAPGVKKERIERMIAKLLDDLTPTNRYLATPTHRYPRVPRDSSR